MSELNISDLDLIRAWKDEEYRSSLTEAQRAQLPDNPAGIIELTDEEMATVHGGLMTLNRLCIRLAVSIAACTRGKGCDVYTWGGDPVSVPLPGGVRGSVRGSCPGKGRG
jgi:mersacidin/lichenicidin family type 2 lantibiotic